MKTLVLKLAYDGTRYAGVQRQANALTVEHVLVEALSRAYKEEAHVVFAGRTDAGVHARGMVAHTRLEHADWIPLERIARALNSLLPDDVRVVGVHLRDDLRFHARYDACLRRYSYTLTRCEDPLHRLYRWHVPVPFDETRLMEAAALFIGTHDFTTFSKLNPEQQSYVCTVQHCAWREIAPGCFRLDIEANRFVYGMVRALVGAMLDYARGKRSLDELRDALAQRDRTLCSPLAPPHGLVLEAVEYPPHLCVQFYSPCLGES